MSSSNDSIIALLMSISERLKIVEDHIKRNVEENSLKNITDTIVPVIIATVAPMIENHLKSITAPAKASKPASKPVDTETKSSSSTASVGTRSAPKQSHSTLPNVNERGWSSLKLWIIEMKKLYPDLLKELISPTIWDEIIKSIDTVVNYTPHKVSTAFYNNLINFPEYESKGTKLTLENYFAKEKNSRNQTTTDINRVEPEEKSEAAVAEEKQHL
jgi:hypothetical protein